MAADVISSASPAFDNFQRAFSEYRASVVRCQAAADEVAACEEETRRAMAFLREESRSAQSVPSRP